MEYIVQGHIYKGEIETDSLVPISDYQIFNEHIELDTEDDWFFRLCVKLYEKLHDDTIEIARVLKEDEIVYTREFKHGAVMDFKSNYFKKCYDKHMRREE